MAYRCIPQSARVVAKPQPPEQLRKSLPTEAEITRSPAAVTTGPGQRGPDEPLLEGSSRVLQPAGANRGRPSHGGGQQRGARPRRGALTASAVSTFCGSRTLPGQSYRASAAKVARSSEARLPVTVTA